MQQGPTIRIGLVAEIADYAITIAGDSVTVAYRDAAPERAGDLVTTQEVPHLARFVGRARELRGSARAVPGLRGGLSVRSRPEWLRLCGQHPGAALLGVGHRAHRSLASRC